MTKKTKIALNDEAWTHLFEKHHILERINEDGLFLISAKQIRLLREPRLMSKFDNSAGLPMLFAENKLSILPVSRGNYVIGRFDAYQEVEYKYGHTHHFTLPEHIQSIDSNNINSEAIALNCAAAAGVIDDFLEDEKLISTVSGRSSSGTFKFNINDIDNKCSPYQLQVNGSQIEIDAAFEGVNSLTLFEAKLNQSKDLLVRQLYYPFRTWGNKINKPVRTVFMTYSNYKYFMHEYKFEKTENYNSLVLVRNKNYSIASERISANDLKEILRQAQFTVDSPATFPQADTLDRIINICEILQKKTLNLAEIREYNLFTTRQSQYYISAAEYLGLVKKQDGTRRTTYTLSKVGKDIMKLNYKQRQLAFCTQILSHKPFNETLKLYFLNGKIPSTKQIVNIMKNSNLNKAISKSTYERRAVTVRRWTEWMIDLIS